MLNLREQQGAAYLSCIAKVLRRVEFKRVLYCNNITIAPNLLVHEPMR